MKENVRVADYFSEPRDYDPREKESIDSCVEVEEYWEYIQTLLGDKSSSTQLIDYAQRSIKAADVIEEWIRTSYKLNQFYDDIRTAMAPNKGMPYGIMEYWNTTYPDAPFGMFRDADECCEAVDAWYRSQLRRILLDPAGKYLLAWGDFCHTGRDALILHPASMRRVAVLLLNEVREKVSSDSDAV